MDKIEDLMPNTYNFFSKGCIFNNHYANAEWTLPSLATIFTGNYTHNHGLFHPFKRHVIGEDQHILSELFQNNGYLTFQAGSPRRANPNYGYCKGFDRIIFHPEIDCDQVVSDFFDHNRSFKNRDQFNWISFCNIHHFLKLNPPITSQVELPINYLFKDENKQKVKSVFEPYSELKIKIFIQELKRIDFYLGQIFDFVEKNYSNEEYLITIVTDHGHSYFSKSTDSLSTSKISIPWMIRGKDIPAIVSNEITENVDVFNTLTQKSEINIKGIDSDSNLPKVLGGKKARNFSFSESFYPTQAYKSIIKDKEYTFNFETQGKADDNGCFKLDPYLCSLKKSNSSEEVINDNLYEQYLQECLKKANKCLNNHEKRKKIISENPEWFKIRLKKLSN